MQEPAAWKALAGFVLFQSLLSSAQGTKVQGLFVCKWCFYLIRCACLYWIKQRDVPKFRVHVGVSGVWCQSEQVLHYFLVLLAWHCLWLGFFLLPAALSVYSGSRVWSLSFKIFVCKICFLPHLSYMLNTIYSISPSPICEPDYIRGVMNNEQGNSFSKQRKYLEVFCLFSFQEIKKSWLEVQCGLYNFHKIPLSCCRGGCLFLLCVGPPETLIFQRHLKRKHGIPSQCVAFSGCM